MKRTLLTTLALLTIACAGEAPPDLAVDHAVPADVASAAGAVQGVCERTPQIRDEIVRVTGAATCDVVTGQDLAGISTWDLAGSGIEVLRQGDFSGLSNLTSLDLSGNALTTLPSGVFAGLSSLQSLDLGGNDLATLPAQVFAGLPNLESLRLSGNALTLDLSGNNLTMLPEPVFSGLSSLQSLNLVYSPGSPSERDRVMGSRRAFNPFPFRGVAVINFQLNGKTVSIRADEEVLTFFFGHLNAEPELHYSGRVLASLGSPAWSVELLESSVLSDIAESWLVGEKETRELLVALSDVRNTNGFIELYGWTGEYISGCYIFRNDGWQYEVCSVAGRTFNYREGTEEYEKMATYARYSLTLRSPDGKVYSFEKTVGESPSVG